MADNFFKNRRKLMKDGWRKAWVQLQDEAPKIGSGFRHVWVKEGRKWAHLKSRTGNAKIAIRDLARLEVKA